jgi:hypothetical protein
LPACIYTQELPDWRASLTPASVKPVTPVMAIKFEGQVLLVDVGCLPGQTLWFAINAAGMLLCFI